MQKNGHPDKNKTMIAVAISVPVVSFVLIMFAVVFVRRRCARRGFCPDSQKAIEEGKGETPLQIGINLLCVLYRKFRSILKQYCIT